jgi:hypothetical protein
MDPIGVYELSSYIIDASGTSPELAVYATEIRAYGVQRANAANTIFVAEPTGYVVQTPRPKTGVAVKTFTAYMIGLDAGTIHLAEQTRTGRGRSAGVYEQSTQMYTIDADNTSYALSGSGAAHNDAGVKHTITTMYTIEVP